VDFIRGDRRFDTVELLVAQMDKDCARARQILAESRSRGARAG
jgi:riboflavin kinase/FMN adenylyltransferase